jgi:hypothetical protein
VNSVRRRRRDHAVVKTIGLTRRECRLVTFCLVSLVLGGPLGVIAGGATWPLVVPATVAIGYVVAAIPGWLAARVGPAAVLRTA